MSDPTGKAARVARSRAACSGCRSTKQKCDGPSRIPCRRCQLYNIVCEYPPSSGPTPSAPAASTMKSANVTAPPPLPTLPTYTNGSVDPTMKAHLQDISTRLRSIESSLSSIQLGGRSSSSAHSHDAFSPTFDGQTHSPSDNSSPHDRDREHDREHDHDDSARSAAEVHPVSSKQGDLNAVQTVADTLILLEAIEKMSNDTSGPSPPSGVDDLLFSQERHTSERQRGTSGSASVFTSSPAFIAPDVVLRGVMTSEECEVTFKIFSRLLAPWVPMFDPTSPLDAMAVRENSPLLFHAVLLSTSYYLMETSDRGQSIYHALMAIVNELMAPIVLSTQPCHLKSDNVRALGLLLTFKPVQFATLWAAGVRDPVQAEHMSKLSSTSSTILMGVISRLALTLKLHLLPNTFARLHSSGERPLPPDLLADLRLWFWTLIIDGHGVLTTSRSSLLDINPALKVTRLFASLRARPFDVRLAANVELYGILKPYASSAWFAQHNVSPASGSGPPSASQPIPHAELRRFNREMDEWDEYWAPELERAASAEGGGDSLAPNLKSLWFNLAKLIINASVFSRWQRRRSNANPRPHLSQDDWTCLQHVLDSAEQLIFALCVESRVPGSNMRRVQWPKPKAGGPRPKLTLDPIVVDAHKTVVDPVACVAYIYPLILVTKMVNAGLAICEMMTFQSHYEQDRDSNTALRPHRLVRGAKLGELLDLGAEFLEAIAPTKSHPARQHARMLRTIVMAGMLGQRPQRPPVVTNGGGGASTPAAAASSTLQPQPRQQQAPPSRQQLSPRDQPATFALPPLGSTPSSSSSPGGSSSSISNNDGGEALATILNGLQPGYFGNEGMFNFIDRAPAKIDSTGMSDNLATMTAEAAASGYNDDMTIDWDSLEKTISSAFGVELPAQQHGNGNPGMADLSAMFNSPLN